MKHKENQFVTGRRDALKMFGLGSAALMMGEFGRIPSVDMFETPEMAVKNKAVTQVGRTSVAFTNGSSHDGYGAGTSVGSGVGKADVRWNIGRMTRSDD